MSAREQYEVLQEVFTGFLGKASHFDGEAAALVEPMCLLKVWSAVRSEPEPAYPFETEQALAALELMPLIPRALRFTSYEKGFPKTRRALWNFAVLGFVLAEDPVSDRCAKELLDPGPLSENEMTELQKCLEERLSYHVKDRVRVQQRMRKVLWQYRNCGEDVAFAHFLKLVSQWATIEEKRKLFEPFTH